ncbi:mitochondrial uncoupling protein 4-like [Saccostrea echinata]|uniref:mitochondrial uncoupling protein 4-like n=1 Tax=Saccostrea echinata TaxID=191078 RepID=UPI002A7FAB5E|nr:mitochondrial uncoupling protein 4-like [Saccostrea echinata]
MTGGSKLATPSSADSFWFKYVLSSIAAVCAETATYPLDLTKTRLQIQGEKAGDGALMAKRGMVSTALGIVREEGVLSLYQGLQPALIRHIVYTGSRMSIYELFREHILQREADGSFPVWKASLGGLIAGALGQLIASPTDLIKVQMQMEGRRKLEGKPPRVKGFFDAFQKIVAESGVKGLYRGVVPNVQRAALVNMGDLCTYDTAKQNILRYTDLKDNYVTHSLASACSGLVAATFGTPADVVKTRIMNQPTKNGKGLLYTGSVDCLIKTSSQEGVMALYKGFIPIWLRMAPWSLCFWLSFEKIRQLAGASSF